MKWKFKSKIWILWLFLFWFSQHIILFFLRILSTSENITKLEDYGNKLVIFLLIAFAIWFMSKERNWKMPIRILWVFGVWILHAVLSVGIVYIGLTGTDPSFTMMKGSILATVPFYFWGMSRSTVFVRKVENMNTKNSEIDVSKEQKKEDLYLSKIKDLKKLYDDGIISKEDFESKKKEILSRY